jgi:D-arabinose 1-dehydrogenase-like Zn-dependent alcohol dehydrogenase
MISCTSPRRAAYGWQRDGGHADYVLAEEATCVALPDELSYVDGALVACGFGTAYEPLRRMGVSGRTGCWSPASARSASPSVCSPRRWARRG